MSTVDWRALSQEPMRVEAVLSALIIDMHPGATRMDGSGGDGGRDVIWHSPDGLVTFEIKSFSDRLHGNQKRQIERSLDKALAHDPVRWVLVMPLDHSPAEESWFREHLCEQTDVPLEWMGRTTIDLELAKRPHIIKGFVTSVREAALEAVAEYSQEQALLSGGAPDLRRRVEALQVRASEADPHYDLGFASRKGTTELSLWARTPDAAEQRPITGSFTIRSTDDAEGQAVLDAYIRSRHYGSAVHIPAQHLESATFDAPFGLGFAANVGPDGEVESTTGMGMPSIQIGPTKEDLEWGSPGRITVIGADGSVSADVAIDWCGRNSGSRGCELHGRDRLGRFTFTTSFDWPDQPARSLNLQVSFNLTREVTPVEMLQALDWADALGVATKVRFDISGEPVLVAGGALTGITGEASYAPGLRPLIEDMACIQQATRPFGLPEDITLEQVGAVRFAARLLREQSFDEAQSEVAMTITVTNPELFIEDAGRNIERAYAQDLTLDLGFLGSDIAVGCLSSFQGWRIGTRHGLQTAVRRGSTVRLRIAVTDGVLHHQLRAIRRG